MRRCGMWVYVGLGQERKCRKEAVAVFDAGKPGGCPVCEKHKAMCHPLRISPLAPEKGTRRSHAPKSHA